MSGLRRLHIPDAYGIPLLFAVAKLVLQALAITRFGYFRDELYYLACSERLAWGYVDQPPLSIGVLALNRALWGDSLVALRWLPAVAGAANIVVIGLLVTKLGGRRTAQALACLCALCAPLWLAVDHFFSMNAFDTLFWSTGALLLVHSLERPALWPVLGVEVGLGLLNKTSLLWFIGAVFIGLLVSEHRRQLLTRWPWLAVAIAALVFSPYLAWEARHDWPTLEFMRNATANKMVHTGFVSFWAQQLALMNPGAFLVAALGAGALLTSTRWRILGVLFVAVAALLLASGSSRPNYLAVAYAPLFAAGAVSLEQLAARRRWLSPVAFSVVGGLGLILLPASLPLLPVEQHVAYTQALHLQPRAQERADEGELPQVFADMFGWEELAERVARVFHALSAEEQRQAVIYTDNYGEAAALEFFGRKHGLPPVISGHNNYWLWGTYEKTGEVVILVGGSRDDAHANFRSVELVDTTSCRYCMPYENHAPLFVGRHLDRPLSVVWPDARSYR